MKMFLKVFFFFFFVFLLSANLGSTTLAAEYSLSSSDTKVQVVLDSKFGGAITKLYDFENMGNLNLVDGFQAGAMFQTAFWILPRHTQLPPGCRDTGDMWLDNPTQAGFVGDGAAGNPIGIMGTDTTAPDANEFINFEDANKTIHLKSRFIRYDYCKSSVAAMGERVLWDTDFYLEQWVSFHPSLPRTLVLRNKIIYVGASPRGTTSRQLPVIFACNLPKVTYWKNGQKVSQQNLGSEIGIDPDSNWAALTAANKDAGIGMVTSKTMTPMYNRSKFNYVQLYTSINQCSNNGPLSVLFPGGGVPDLRTMGTVNNIDYDAPSNHIFIYNPNSSFEWTTYYPIGMLDLIKNNADLLLEASAYNRADLDTNGDVDIFDYNILVQSFARVGAPGFTPADIDKDGDVDIFDYNILVGNFGRNN